MDRSDARRSQASQEEIEKIAKKASLIAKSMSDSRDGSVGSVHNESLDKENNVIPEEKNKERGSSKRPKKKPSAGKAIEIVN